MPAGSNLCEGPGARSSRASASLIVTPEAREIGHAAECVRVIVGAIHGVNRRSVDGRRLAFDMPGLSPESPGLPMMGDEIVVYGDPDLVDAALADKALSRLVRGKALTLRRADGAEQTHGMERSRRGEKATPAGLARARRRVEARGGVWTPRTHRGEGTLSGRAGTVFVTLNDRVRLRLTRRAVMSDDMASGYGCLARPGREG